MKTIIKCILLLIILLPIGVASAGKATNVKATGLVNKVIDREQAYIVVSGIKYRVPAIAKVSERYSEKPLRLRHVLPGMTVEVHFRRKAKNEMAKLRSIEIIPQ